jgi:hypothetical protein
MSGRERDGSGATAIIVGVLAAFLVGVAAFTVDAGAAFVSNRNLQRAADAGALAAAQHLTQFPGTCNNIVSNSDAVGDAHDIAIEVAKANYKFKDDTDETWAETGVWDVRCDPDLRVLEVIFGNEGTTQAAIAPIFGGDEEITTSRDAEATVDVAPGAGESVRPLALCSAQVQVVPQPSTYPFVRIDAPKNATKLPTTCPAKTGSGNWWVVDCPDEDPGESTEEQIEFGCENPVSVIPGQEDAVTPGELTLAIGGECAPKDDDENCLSGDTGNIDSGHTADKWELLVKDESVAIFPVFCAVPQCSASTIEGTGTNAVYPVFKMVAAVICGFHFSKTERYVSTTGECAGMPSLYTSDDWEAGNDVNFMLLKYVSERTSVSNEESECALGAECDGLLRRTRLTGGGE